MLSLYICIILSPKSSSHPKHNTSTEQPVLASRNLYFKHKVRGNEGIQTGKEYKDKITLFRGNFLSSCPSAVYSQLSICEYYGKGELRRNLKYSLLGDDGELPLNTGIGTE